MLQDDRRISRRQMLARAAGTAAALASSSLVLGQTAPSTMPAVEPIIDIHQHTTYWGRSNQALLHHQRKMGVTQTILQPGGTPVITESTLKGKANGLYAGAGTVDTCIAVAQSHPHVYYFGSNEVPDLPEAHDRIVAALKKGAVCVGEQKFNLPVDSPEMERIYAIAQDFDVPILMHFQVGVFNTGYERLGKVLAKWPKVKFIAHAQTFWANIDAKNVDNAQALYPKGKITPGGISDRYLSDHENFFGDLSAGSGLNALTRDEEHAVAFITRHQDKLVFGSDCPDPAGEGPTCTGASMIKLIRRIAPTKTIERKLLHDNATKLFRLA